MRPTHVALVLAALAQIQLAATAGAADPLARARLEIQGSRLAILAADAEQTVGVAEPAQVRTCFGGAGTACGAVAPGDPRVAGLAVLAELRGPELPEPQPLRTLPGGTFLLPSFQRAGDYVLDNVRLVNTATRAVLGLAEPSRAVLHVAEIVLTSATVTTLSLADLQARGIQLSQSNFQAFNFAVGFAFGGQTVTIELPLLYDGVGTAAPLEPPTVQLDQLPEALRPIVERWKPPSLVPFVLVPEERELLAEEDVTGGTLEFPLFGAIVIPGTVSFLNQFFDARLVVANGAPAGSGASLSNLKASLRLPAGNVLRLAATDPPVTAGQLLPLLLADGSRAVPAGQQASAAWTVEGLKAGTHVLQIDLTGDLLRPGRTALPLASMAQAAVEVVDARFNLTFSHPDVVRADEAYTLYVTVTNLSRATQNHVTVALHPDEISGAHRADPLDAFERTAETLAPGQAQTFEFALVSEVTGKCFATTFQSDSPGLEGTIRLRAGVGTLGIPLSPATLLLPRFSERLGPPYVPSDELLRANLRLLGLAHSLATAPAGLAPAELPVLTTSAVERRAIDLAEAGQRTFLRAGLLESLEVLALDQLGNRHPLEGFDELRRRLAEAADPRSDLLTGPALATLLRQQQVVRGLDAVGLLDHFAETTSYAAPYLAALLVRTGAAPAPELEVLHAVAGGTQMLSGGGGGALRTVPFGEMLDLNCTAAGEERATLALIGHLEPADVFQLRLRNPGPQPAEGRLVVVLPQGESGHFRRIDFGEIEVPPGAVLRVDAGARIHDPGDGGFRLLMAADGADAGFAVQPEVRPVELPPFRIIGAVQDYRMGESRGDAYGDLNRPNRHGNGIAYLFNRPPASSITADPAVFAVRSAFDGLDVLAAPVHVEAVKTGRAAFIQDDPRVLLVRYSGPISALGTGDGTVAVTHQQTVATGSVEDRLGEALAAPLPQIDVETTPPHVGGLVVGSVERGSGAPAAGAVVQLLRTRHTSGLAEVVTDVVEETTTDGSGAFVFDFVELPHWDRNVDDQFTLRASVSAGSDPVTEPAEVGEVSSVIRQQDRLARLKIALLGRGTVAGRLVYADSGAPVAGASVSAANTLFAEMKTTSTSSDGGFTFAGMAIGPVTLTGRDHDGNVAYATIGLDRAGALVETELRLARALQPGGEGTVAGRVECRRGGTQAEERPLAGAQVSIYAGGTPIAQQQTDPYGRFRFDHLPAGQIAVQAADWRISRTAAYSDLLLAANGLAEVTLVVPSSAPHAVSGSVFFHNPATNALEPVMGAVVVIAGPGVSSRSAGDGTYRIEGVPEQGITDQGYTVRAIDGLRHLEGQARLPAVLQGSADVISAPAIVLEEPYGGVDGVVLDPLGRPYGGAGVVLFPYGTTTADGSGHFSFSRVPLGPIGRLIAHVSDGLRPGHVGYFEKVSTSVICGGHRPFSTIRMRGAGIVRVRTTTATATGVKSLVYFRPTMYHDGAKDVCFQPEYTETSTDDDGRLDLELPVGGFEIVTFHPFHGRRSIGAEIEFPGQVRSYSIVYEDAGSLEVTVLDADGVTPAPNVTVTLETGTLLPQREQSDALGRRTFHLVPQGNFRVAAVGLVGGIERVGSSIGAITASSQSLEVSVRLKPQGSVSGCVKERRGDSLVAVPYAQVYLREDTFPNRRLPDDNGFAFADAQGRYQFQHAYAGGVTVTARDPAQVSRTGLARGVITADWQIVEMPDIVLSTSVGALEVTVRDAGTGSPVPDCQVTLDGEEATVTDASGVASFEAVPLGAHAVYAFHASSGRGGRLGNLQVTSSGQTLVVTLDLGGSGEVHGTLFDDAAHRVPVPGATVELRGTTAVGDMRALATTGTEATNVGQFDFLGIPEGRFTLQAGTPSSARRAGADVELSALAPIANLALVLEPAGDVSVRLFERLRGNGTGILSEIDPATGVFNVRFLQGGYDFTQLQPAVAAPGHRYDFSGVLLSRTGSIWVQELSAEQRSGRLDVADLEASGPSGGDGTPGDPYHVVLAPKGTVRVLVRDAQGRPIAGATVALSSTGGMTASEATDASGETLFTAVPAGSLTAASSSSLTGQGGVAYGSLAFDDDIVDLTVTVAPTVAAHGVVYQPVPGDAFLGDPVTLPPQANAVVEITDALGGRQAMTSGADGSYRFVGLAPGTCTLKAWQPGADGFAQEIASIAGPDGNENLLPPMILDASAPRILSITPAPGMTGVSRTATVEVTFSEPLAAEVLPRAGNGGSVFTLRSASGETPAGTWSSVVDAPTGRQLVRFSPAAPYENLTVYGLSVDGGDDGVRDRVGRLLAEFGSVGSNFTTADTVGPEVIGSAPPLSRPINSQDGIRIDFNEGIVASEEALDGDGVDDAAELDWARATDGGALEWQPYPVSLALTRSAYSLLLQPLGGITLTGDSLRRRIHLAHVADTAGNAMAEQDLTFRARDGNPPRITVALPATAPDGRLSAGVPYVLTPAFAADSIDFVTETPPAGDVDRVEYFLNDPTAAGAAPTYVATTFPFAFSFVAAYSGNGQDPSPMPVWVRATDTSENASNLVALPLQVVKNEPPTVAAVDVAATAPVAGVFYAGSTVRASVTGLADPDGVEATLSAELWQEGATAALATRPGMHVQRPGSGNWVDLPAPVFEFTLPLSLPEGSQLFVRARALDLYGAAALAESARFALAHDASPPRVDGIVARRSPDGATPPVFYIADRLFLEFSARDNETALSTLTITLDHLEIFSSSLTATRVPGSGSLYHTGVLTVPHDAFTAETSVTATVTATDVGGNTGSGTLAIRLAPAADTNAPSAQWLTPWDGGLWPASYVSTVSTADGVAMLVRVAAQDTADDGAGGIVPGHIAAVELRGPVRDDAGAIVLGSAPVEGAIVPGTAGVGGASYECIWRVPNGIPPGTTVPFEVRVVDTGGVSTTVPARLVARPARRVFEGVETAVLPQDAMLAPGGDPSGPIFLLDGATVSLYPASDELPRRLASLFIYSGGESDAPVDVHPSVLTAPQVTSYASAALYYPLELRANETLGVGAASRIDVSGAGLLGNTSSQAVSLPGETSAAPFAGGSHGGLGWFGSRYGGWTRTDQPSDYLALPGSTYDGVRDPRLPGSGGTSVYGDAGGRGGGVVRLLADSALLRLEGSVIADGTSGVSGGGGAGGAVMIQARRLEGRGRISANGGHGTSGAQTGGGGGGRIALAYRELGAEVDLVAQAKAAGGWTDDDPAMAERYGGAGTVYLEPLDPVTGEAIGASRLVVANDSGKPAAVTPLPALGDGTLLSIDPASRELAIDAPFARGQLVGDAVVVTDANGAEIATLRITAQQSGAETPGAPRQLRLTVEATEQQLADLQALLGGAPVGVHSRARYAAVEGRGAARIAASDDLVIGAADEPDPALNQRSSLTLDGEARALLQGESPHIVFDATPPPGGDIRVGSVVAVSWTASDPLGVASSSESWSLMGAPSTRLLVEPVLTTSGASPLSLPIRGAPPGAVHYDVTVADLAGRTVAQTATWNVLPNSPPIAVIAFGAGTPPAVLPGQRVTVAVDATDLEGLQQITCQASGPVSPASQSTSVSGAAAHATFSFSVAETATPSDIVTIRADVLDAYAASPTSTSTLTLGVLPDDEPPEVTVTLAPERAGDTYTAGDGVTVTITASDNVAVPAIGLTIDGQTFASQMSPLVHIWTAPAVGETTAFQLQAQANDPAGHQTTVTRTLTVQPLVNPAAPSIHFTCPSNGAYLPVGYDALVLQATATDDIGVASVEFFRGGDSLPFATVTPSAGTLPTFVASTTAPPLPAVGGQDVQFRARARDASNNATDALVTIHVVDAVTLIPSGDNDWSALVTRIGVLRAGTLTLDQPHNLAGLIVLRNALITHSPSTPGAETSVNLSVTGPVYVESGGSIDVKARGYAANQTYPGAVAPGFESGGSHLGHGGVGSDPVASTFGSVYRPQESGGGGENSAWGQRGGGAVRLSVGGHLVCDGSILANGVGGSRAGAGGSIWIAAAAVSGGGTIEARGGDTNWRGSGGGGAIAVEFESASGAAFEALRAAGGATGPKGGAGTVYLKGPMSTFGELIVDNGGIDGQSTELPSLGSGTAQAGSEGEVLVTDLAVAIPAYFGGHWVEVTGADGTLKGTWRIGVIAERTVHLEGNDGEVVSVLPGDHWQGVYRFEKLAVKGHAKLDSQDGARVGTVSVETGSQLLWFDDTPPVIAPSKIALTAHDRAFWVTGATGAVVDPGGVASALLHNQRSGESVAITVGNDGQFAMVQIPGVAGDVVEVVATSRHARPATSWKVAGVLPANAGAPAITAASIAITRDAGGQRHVVGSVGAVVDNEPPVALGVLCQPSGATASGVAGATGAFDLAVACRGGDRALFTATDGHPQPLSSSLDLGTVIGNAAPVVDAAEISISYGQQTDRAGGRDKHPVAKLTNVSVKYADRRSGGGYVLTLAAGAVTDDKGPLDLRLAKANGLGIDASVMDSGQAFDWVLPSSEIHSGDLLQLTVSDRDPTEPLSTTVQIGPLPPDNYGPPTIDPGQISLLPMGFGFQVVGKPGAVIDPDQPVLITLSNARAGWVSRPVVARDDGSFYARLVGVTGDEIAILASDSHTVFPMNGDTISVGELPDREVTVNPVDLQGHTVAYLRDQVVVLDGGVRVAKPDLLWDRNEEGQEEIGTPVGGFSGATDWVLDERTSSPLVLDGTDLVPWVCADECPVTSPGRLRVIETGTLVRGITYAGYLFLAAEDDAVSVYVIPPPLTDGVTGAITPGGPVASLVIPASGAHALELFPGFAGEIALLTDQPTGAVIVVDVANPAAPVLARSIDLAGTAVPTWGVWKGGELVLGRGDGSVEIWRWGDSTLERWTRWQPAGAVARRAARMGDQLWVGLSDGRMQQIDLLDPAAPEFCGELQLGSPLVAVADLGDSLLAATEGSLVHIWPSVMPPEVNPEDVAWGHESGWSWARSAATSSEGVASTSVRWGGIEESFGGGGGFVTMKEESTTPPTVAAADTHGIPSDDYTPSSWQPWGSGAGPGGVSLFPESIPISLATPAPDRGTFGTVSGDATGWQTVPWIATAVAGSSAIEFAYYSAESAWDRELPVRQTLAATGAVAEVVGFDDRLYVLDDGLGVWDLSDPGAPILTNHFELFGTAPVTAARFDEKSWPPVVLAAGGDPVHIVAIDVSAPEVPAPGAEIVLPDASGTVVDLARARDGTVVVLLADAEGARLLRADLHDPQAPVVVGDIRLPSGAPATALDVECTEDEWGCGEDAVIVVVRQGWGVEVRAFADLQLLHALPLRGVARDVVAVNRRDTGGISAYVTVGFGLGVASISGLPGSPEVTYLGGPGDPRRIVRRPGADARSALELLTATGVVNQPVPRIPPLC